MVSIPHSLIVSRVLRRPALRTELVTDPRGTLARRFDVKLPADVAVVVVEDTAKKVHLVVPAEPGLRGPEPGRIGEALTRFRTDRPFRDAFTRDPKGVIQAETGATLPGGVELEVVVETPARRVIQLPPPDAEDQVQAGQMQSLYGGGDDGEYYEAGTSELVGGCSNVDTVTWSCCESDVNENTILMGGDCCGEIEEPDPDETPPPH